MISLSLPFSPPLSVGAIAGLALWALAFYLAFSPLVERLIDQCHRALSALAQRAAGRAPGKPQMYPRQPHPRQDAILTLLASLVSVLPFLALGSLAYYGLALSLGGSWATSTGLIATIGSGVYELGRQQGQASGS